MMRTNESSCVHQLVLVLNLPKTWANQDSWSPYLSKIFNSFLTLKTVIQQKKEIRKAKVLSLFQLPSVGSDHFAKYQGNSYFCSIPE